MKIKYTGKGEVLVMGIGKFKPNELVTVSKEEGNQLIQNKDFEKVDIKSKTKDEQGEDSK